MQFIDATVKGGRARFINHSCDPNCVLEKWQVGGRHRMAVLTRRAVPAGQELSYDYKLEWDGCGQLVLCSCGAQGCKGKLGARSYEEGVALLGVARAGEYKPGLDGELQAVGRVLDSFDSD